VFTIEAANRNFDGEMEALNGNRTGRKGCSSRPPLGVADDALLYSTGM